MNVCQITCTLKIKNNARFLTLSADDRTRLRGPGILELTCSSSNLWFKTDGRMFWHDPTHSTISRSRAISSQRPESAVLPKQEPRGLDTIQQYWCSFTGELNYSPPHIVDKPLVLLTGFWQIKITYITIVG